MTTETIQTLKEDIAILQEKLRKLEEQDPEMLLLRQGKVDFVDYNGKGGNKYIRIEYTDSFAGEYNWCVRRVGEDAIRPVRDVNVYALLEELYQKEVVKQKDDYPYKKYTPEETEQSLKEAFREAVKQGVVSSKETPQERGERVHNEAEELITKIYDGYGVVSSSNKPQNLYDLIADCMVNYNSTVHPGLICDILDAVEEWLPDEHYSDGEDYDLGFNDCLNKIKGKLR